MKTVEIILEFEDELGESFERMWREGYQVILQPENWKCFKDAPPITVACETKD